MPKLSQKEFAQLVASMPGASDDEIIAAAREIERRSYERPSLPQPPQPKDPSLWQWLNRPTIDLPDIDMSTNTGIVAVDAFSRVPGLVGGLIEGMSSPIGLASLAVPAVGAAARAKALFGVSRAARAAEAGLSAPYVVSGAQTAAEGIMEGDSAKAATGALESGLGAFGVRSAMTGAFPVKEVAKAYQKKMGISNPPPQFATEWNEDFAKRVADAYEGMRHAPDDPAVRASYEALADEVRKQFDFITKRAGLKVRPSVENYPSSAAMIEDVTRNNQMRYFPTEAGYGQGEVVQHPLLHVDPDGIPLNDKFRVVHDYFGHAQNRFQFGPLGEENAYREHAAMFSDAALPALTTETRGQNSWVNAGRHLRRADGSLPKKGDPDFIPPQNRPYAEQKAGLLPREFIGNPTLDEMLNSGQDYGILSAHRSEFDALRNAARHQELVERIRALGYTPMEQMGVYGAAPEKSVLVPGMTPEHAKSLGRLYDQDAVISREGWHRLGDDATFPRIGSAFDQTTPDFYSEIDLPRVGKVKYQLQFPDEAYKSVPSASQGEPAAALPRAATDPTIQDLGGESLSRRSSSQHNINLDEEVPAFELIDDSSVNASGESAASLEALNRQASMKARGEQFAVKKGGTIRLLIGPDAVDYQPRKGETFGIIDKEGRFRPLSTASAIAGPAAAMGIEDDPDSDWDNIARAVLMGAGGVAAVGYFPKKLRTRLEQVVAPLKKAKAPDKDISKAVRESLRSVFPGQPEKVRKYQELWEAVELPKFGGVDFDRRVPLKQIVKKRKDGYDLSSDARQRLEVAYQVGAQKIDGWGDAAYIAPLVGGDPEMGAVFARFLGATSPASDTKMNVLRALETFIRVALRDEAPEAVMATLKSPKPRYGAANITRNLGRAKRGERISSEKVEALAGGEAGFFDDIPLDIWFLRALGARSDKTPSGPLYDAVRQAARRVAKEKGEELYPWMAKVWVGMQHIANSPSPSYKSVINQLDIPTPITDPRAQQWILENMDVLRNRLSVNYQPSLFEPAKPDLPQPDIDVEAFKREMREAFARGKTRKSN